MKEKTKVFLAVIIAVLTIIIVCSGVYIYINKDVYFGNKEDSTQNITETTKETTTESRFLENVDFSEYDISMSKTGNLIGNLNKKAHGVVAYKGRNEFHSVPNVGIYSFNVDTEVATLILGGEGEFNYQYLNVVGSKIYFINSLNNVLYTCDINGKNLKELAQNVTSVFVYDKNIFYISNGVYKMKIDSGQVTELMKKELDEEFSIIGVSNTRLYISAKSESKVKVNWYSININKPKDAKEFFKDTGIGEISSPQYTEGWFYFTRYDDTVSNLYRQRIGDESSLQFLSSNIVDFTVKINCVYYGANENGVYNTYELNTDSKDIKTVSITSLKEGIYGDMESFIGTEYVYALGTSGADNAPTYTKTCIFTAANLIMTYDFNSRSWSFA